MDTKTNTSVRQTNEKPDTSGKIRNRMRQVVTMMLLIVGILFISAGRLDWVWGWVYFGMYAGGLMINALVLVTRHPEMVAERSETRQDAKGWDKALGALISIPTFAIFIVAGLDVRFEWSPQLALAVHLVAICLAMLGNSLFTWAMASNEFFSRVVSIQVNRGHTVATGGPYRYIRHPGYAGMIISMLATALLLGSLWALIPAGLAAGLYVVRTALEDRTLHEELEGYRDYAWRVPNRLFPGVW